MSVRLRLQRRGKKKEPYYRVVATNRSSSSQSGCIEEIGYYRPVASGEEDELDLDDDRVQYWLDNGAQPSETVRDLLRRCDLNAN